MISLKKIFRPTPHLLTVSKTEKELLEYFLCSRSEYDNWLLLHPQPKIRFKFYFPTAIDFYFDGAKLFTAYFKKGAADEPVLSELKMSKANYSSIRSSNWKPFEEVMIKFLNYLEETNRVVVVQNTKPLHDYLAICKETAAGNKAGKVDEPLPFWGRSQSMV
ncbi:hypothetical protein [Flavisolibacter nicotianae]|uniref:hypothetical protein n=1 Tax=Flavisolibacter nicotianae TaxID=2364882 RepID=UPI0013C40BB0|nr:hypothetical protein [Flavisolibacter nicotianae]